MTLGFTKLSRLRPGKQLSYDGVQRRSYLREASLEATEEVSIQFRVIAL